MSGTRYICKTSSISRFDDLQEEVKQLRAALQVYKELVEKLTTALETQNSVAAERFTLRRVS